MSDKGNVVIAGDEIFATIDEALQDDQLTGVQWAMVIEFDSKEAFQKAWKAGGCEFTKFEDRKS